MWNCQGPQEVHSIEKEELEGFCHLISTYFKATAWYSSKGRWQASGKDPARLSN